MNPLFEATREICGYIRQQGWEFCIIGGLAVQQWGEPRTTLDVDITLVVPWGDEEEVVDELLSRFTSRLSDAREFALARRVLLLTAFNGKDVDVTFGALPFELEMVSRAKMLEFAPGVEAPCCSAEDLFIMKVFAGRPRDIIDAQSIVARQQRLDHVYIVSQLEALSELKEDPEIIRTAKQILKIW